MSSVDLKKTYRDHYTARDEPVLVEIAARPFLMIDGEGDPNTAQAYQDALATLYPLAYGVRKAVKDATGIAYTVMPLEGLWWVDDWAEFDIADKSNWKWTMLISLPDEATPDLDAAVIADVTAKKNLPSGDLARYQHFGDGPAAQILHRGPYAAEGPTIARLHGFITDEGYRFGGEHHEIYLTDVRRSAPENNRTIIRQPVTR